MTSTGKNAFQPRLEALDDRCLPSAGLVPRLHLPAHAPHHRAPAGAHRLAVHHHPAALHHPPPHHPVHLLFVHHRFVHHPRVFVPVAPVVEPFVLGPDYFPDGGFSPFDFGVGPAVDFSGFGGGDCGCGDFGAGFGGDFGGDFGGGDFGDGGDF